MKIDPNSYIKAFEQKVTPFMLENGMIDGKFLARSLRTWKPKIAQYIDIPEKDFRLVELTDILAKLIGLGGINA